MMLAHASIVAIVVAAFLGGCTGTSDEEGGAGDPSLGGDVRDRDTEAHDSFTGTFQREFRFVLDHTVEFPTGGADREGGESFEIEYLGNSTPREVALLVTWVEESPLSESVRVAVGPLADERVEVRGAPPLRVSFEPQPGNDWVRINLDGPVGFGYDVAGTVEGTIWYERT